MRLAALMELPVIYVYTHDSIGLGEDGPTHQPIEQLATLRATPNVNVVRPGRRQRDGAGLAGSRSASRRPVLRWCSAARACPSWTRTRSPATRSSGAPTCCATRRRRRPRRDPDRHRLRGRAVPRRGREARGRRPAPPGWSACPAGTASWSRTGVPATRCCRPPCAARVSVEAAATLGWDRWVGRGRRVHRHDRLRRLRPGGRALRALRIHPRQGRRSAPRTSRDGWPGQPQS